jgi:hypothetical protein
MNHERFGWNGLSRPVEGTRGANVQESFGGETDGALRSGGVEQNEPVPERCSDLGRERTKVPARKRGEGAEIVSRVGIPAEACQLIRGERIDREKNQIWTVRVIGLATGR